VNDIVHLASRLGNVFGAWLYMHPLQKWLKNKHCFHSMLYKIAFYSVKISYFASNWVAPHALHMLFLFSSSDLRFHKLVWKSRSLFVCVCVSYFYVTFADGTDGHHQLSWRIRTQDYCMTVFVTALSAAVCCSTLYGYEWGLGGSVCICLEF